MSEDPKLFDAGDYNLFRYCHNDPVDNVDPMGLADEPLDPGPTHANQARMADEHVSASQAVWNRQMNMSSSLGAISVGQNQQFFQALAKFISNSRPDAAGLNPSQISTALVRDARDAATEHAKSIRQDQYGRRLVSQERAYAELVKKGGALERQGPFLGSRDEQGQPYTLLTFSRPPISISHSHGPESGAGLDRGDVPSANGHNPMGVPYISSVGWTGDRGRTIHIYVPSGGNSGQFFHSRDGAVFLPGP
jgi:hypothetical protein